MRIFLTPEEGRLRSGWRLLGHSMLLLIFSVLLAMLLSPFAGLMQESLELFLFFGTLTLFLAATISVYLARRLLDRRSFASLGLQWKSQALKDILFGIGLASIMMGLVFLALWSLGWLSIEGFAWEFDGGGVIVVSVLFMLLVYFMVGWYEELLSRGYWLQNLGEGLNLFWAVMLSSAFFALAHLANPNATWNAVLGLLAAGIFLAYGYISTSQLWLPIGLHIGWNFFEGVVFGFQVSGLETFRLIRHTVEGPELVTGGPFGPEAGLIILPALLLGAGVIRWYGRGRELRDRAL